MAARRSFLPQKQDLSTLQTHYEDPEFGKAFPAIYELMVSAKRDGRYRAGARLTFFCDDQRLKASIWDPDTNQVWFVTLAGFQGALEAVERHLQAGEGEWRVKRGR